MKAQLNKPFFEAAPSFYGALAHEYHHWATCMCSTYGLFVNAVRYMGWQTGVTLARDALAREPLRKPVIAQIREYLNREPSSQHVEQSVHSYLALGRMAELLVGSSIAPDFADEFVKLFPYVAIELARLRDAATSDRAKEGEPAPREASRGASDKGSSQGPRVFEPKLIRLLKVLTPLARDADSSTQPIHAESADGSRLTWPVVLEGFAMYFQRAFEDVCRRADGHGGSCDMEIGTKSYEGHHSPYSRSMQVMRGIMGPKGPRCGMAEIVRLQALADLACNPSLDPEYFLPDELSPPVRGFVPGHRFARACQVAREVEDLTDRLPARDSITPKELEIAYMAFIGDVCACLGWEPPWIQAARWLEYYVDVELRMPPLSIFLDGCRERLTNPLFFGVPSHSNWLGTLAGALATPNFRCRETGEVSVRLPTNTRDDMGMQMLGWLLGIADQLMQRPGEFDWSGVRTEAGDEAAFKAIQRKIEQNFRIFGVRLEDVEIG